MIYSPVSGTIRSRVLRTAAVAAFAVLLAGCSSTGDSSTGSSDGPSGASDAPTATYTLPAASTAESRDWPVTLKLNSDDLQITLDGADAPQAVASFLSLSKAGYFDGTACHRLTTAGIFVLQCGDPTGTGTGGPGYNFGPIENAPADDVYPAGTLAMARVGGDAESMGSQFFIVYKDSTIPSDNAGGYTVFGTITGGMDAVQAIAADGASGGGSDGTPTDPATITSVTVN
jgi:peptidyl-prolyl cis-trans isomerase B (cyclophilin B)